MEHTNTTNTPKDAFLHLFNILTFYITVIGFITLYIQFINAWYPDSLNYYYTAIASAVSVGSSILAISVPFYLISGWLLAKDLAKDPEKREFRLRKWLIYFTLFIAAITIVISLIIFIYNFFSGELSMRFFLKTLVVLTVAAAVFGYYIWELRRKDEHSNIPKILAAVLAVIVVASIVAGFFIVGTPTTQRARKFDDKRAGDLQVLQNQIINYWTQKEVLPTDLGQLQDSISGFIVPQDPLTESEYEYTVSSELSFELCATFKTESQDIPERMKMAFPYDSFNQNWSHKAEKTCFSRTIDPELYKDIEKDRMPFVTR